MKDAETPDAELASRRQYRRSALDRTKITHGRLTDFVSDSRAILERISFEVRDILANDDRAAILGSLASKVKRTAKIINTDLAIVLTVAKGEIVCFQILEESFAVSRAARA